MLRVAPILELRIVMALGPAGSSNPVSEGGSPAIRQGKPSSTPICPMSVYITWTGAPGRTADCVIGSRRGPQQPNRRNRRHRGQRNCGPGKVAQPGAEHRRAVPTGPRNLKADNEIVVYGVPLR